MAQVTALCGQLRMAPGIVSAEPARRSQGIASAPEFQVFMMREESVEKIPAAVPGQVQTFRFMARSEVDVQEIEIVAALTHDAMKEVLADVLDAP